ncbi:hypothetical protein BBJ29_008878 [Phytophthora kernoviae]|uniref:Uncharacterized protein n=1 Tax=Phytophthora kernoviae TaxID=325452 RepID=A0A421G0T5_9STRA|nr:hypothetical protein BBJ29_008878 [Phytophthora kernoviae]
MGVQFHESQTCGQTIMTVLRRLQTRVQRLHLLGRYYVNKWHYDGSKWADRVWYGQGSTGNGPAVASVAFMITRSMRQQLVDAGFPTSAISTLQPAVAQKIIADKVTYVQFEDQQKEEQVKQAAEAAKRVLKQEEEQKQKQKQQQQQQQSALVAAEMTKQKAHQEKTTASAALMIQPETLVKETKTES